MLYFENLLEEKLFHQPYIDKEDPNIVCWGNNIILYVKGEIENLTKVVIGIPNKEMVELTFVNLMKDFDEAIKRLRTRPNFTNNPKYDALKMAYIDLLLDTRGQVSYLAKKYGVKITSKAKANQKEEDQFTIPANVLNDLQEQGYIKNANGKPLDWIKDLQDLKMFIDTFYPNEDKKWVKTVNTFTDNGKPIKINSIKNLNPAYKDNPPSENYFKELKKRIKSER